jgi:DNA repair exonuclease SbcCD nuclease subunit
LRECGAYVVAINGNHDVTDSANGLSTLSPLKEALPEVVVCNTPTSMVFGDIDRGIRFLLLPYMAPSWGVRWCETLKMTVPQWVEQQFKQYGNVCVVAGHLSIEGALLGSETLDMPRGRENAFPVTESNGALLRLNGHYHKRQSPHGIWCPGSPVRLAFGEENNPTGWLEWRL